MRVRVARRVSCGNYTKMVRYTDECKPTRRVWQGVDYHGRSMRKKLFECRQDHKCANRTTFLVKCDEEHNLGRADEYMPLKAFVAEFAA